MQGEEARQRKFQKKLEQQVKCGKLTEAEAEEKMQKLGRPKQQQEREEESPSFTLSRLMTQLLSSNFLENDVLSLASNTSVEPPSCSS